MKIVTNNTEYTAIKSLSFSPQTDVAGSQLVINQFVANIFTDDAITAETMVYLYDDADTLWAAYYMTEAVRIDEETMRITGKSLIQMLDYVTMPATMYNAESVTNVLDAIFNALGGSSAYTLDAAFSGQTVTGFCPEQTARVRLQWLVLTIGGYVKTFFTDKIEIKSLSQEQENIPKHKTFWKPSISYGNYVTKVRVVAYSYTQGSPQTTDKWVTDGTNYYIETTQVFELTNNNVPANTPDKVVEIKDVKIISPANVSAILSHLATYYFKRVEVDMDVVNNGEYLPGEKILGYADENILVDGYIKSAAFSFGLQARSKIHIMQTDQVNGATLTINYMNGNTRLKTVEYYFPVGYNYSVANPYLDMTGAGRRRVYYPLTAAATGTVADGGTVDVEQYDVALEYRDSVLQVLSVDEVTQSGERVTIK